METMMDDRDNDSQMFCDAQSHISGFTSTATPGSGTSNAQHGGFPLLQGLAGEQPSPYHTKTSPPPQSQVDETTTKAVKRSNSRHSDPTKEKRSTKKSKDNTKEQHQRNGGGNRRSKNRGMEKAPSLLYSLLLEENENDDDDGAVVGQSSSADDDDDNIDNFHSHHTRQSSSSQRTSSKEAASRMSGSHHHEPDRNHSSSSQRSSRFQIVDQDTGQLYTFPEYHRMGDESSSSSTTSSSDQHHDDDDNGGATTSPMDRKVQRWIERGKCHLLGSVDDCMLFASRASSQITNGSEPSADVGSLIAPNNIIPNKPASETTQQQPPPPSTSNFASSVTEAVGNAKSTYGKHFVPMLNISTRSHVHKGPIWCLRLNKKGTFLASAGADGIVNVWKLGMFGHDASSNKKNNSSSSPSSSPEQLDIQVLSQQPYRRYDEHSGEDVIDLSWSQSVDGDFFLTASLDRTVKLFHTSKSSCLRTFVHNDLVTSVDFHPIDDNMFISGSFDKQIRLWNISRNEVAEWAQGPDLITCVKFHPLGTTVVAGMMKGQVYFYSLETNARMGDSGLNYLTQISCKNKRGIRSDGRKVTGLEFRKVVKTLKVKMSKTTSTPIMPPQQEDEDYGTMPSEKYPVSPQAMIGDDDQDEQAALSSSSNHDEAKKSSKGIRRRKKIVMKKKTHQLLITTNDSRIRLYGMEDFCMLQKMRGLKNLSMQIKGKFSSSGNAVACGSEDGFVYVWESPLNELKQVKRTPLEKMGLHTEHLRKKHSAFFSARDPLAINGAITETSFLPQMTIIHSLNVPYPWFNKEFRKQLDDDISTAFLLTADYEGTIKVFMRRTFLHKLITAATTATPIAQSHESR